MGDFSLLAVTLNPTFDTTCSLDGWSQDGSTVSFPAELIQAERESTSPGCLPPLEETAPLL